MSMDMTMCDGANGECVHRYGCRRYDKNYKVIPDRRAYFLNPAEECINGTNEPYETLAREQK